MLDPHAFHQLVEKAAAPSATEGIDEADGHCCWSRSGGEWRWRRWWQVQPARVSTRLAIGPLASLMDTDAETWHRVFATNVIGAALITSAAIPHLAATNGVAVYLSSVAASITPPWPGLGAYAVSKAALDKLVEAWRVEHPAIGFTRLVVGDCAGGEGESMTEFPNEWDHELAVKFGTQWAEQKYLAGTLIEVDDPERGRLADPARQQRAHSSLTVHLAPRRDELTGGVNGDAVTSLPIATGPGFAGRAPRR